MTETPRRDPHSHVAAITIEIDPAALGSYTDQRLALCWHVAQANPAHHGDRAAGELAERLGREIIRRWLGGTEPELHRHQGRDYYWGQLSSFAKYEPGGPAGSPEFYDGQWVAKDATDRPGGAP
ncbi:MAG TPA: hypothetical protein VK586_12650 [Streptosporangiaceae bacterium]|nr:hypothetical protein [Streptosporangiaceae bacterium]